MVYDFEICTAYITGIWVSLTSFLLMYVILNNIVETDSHVFTVGPNSNFYILGIGIDTVPKYSIVVAFCFINSGIRAMKGNVLNPWIINEIQDVNNKTLIPNCKAYPLVFVSIIYNWFDFFMYMNILLSQIDMLFVEIFADLIVNYGITKHYLHLKRVDDENVNEPILYDTSIH